MDGQLVVQAAAAPERRVDLMRGAAHTWLGLGLGLGLGLELGLGLG